MKRYIDAELADSLLLEGYSIDEVPSADVAPVIHGHWIYKFQYQDGDYCYCCSLCGRYEKVMSRDVINTMPYCHCGAKMDEGKNNGSEIH